MKIPEKDVKRAIDNVLENFELTGDILWFERLQAGIIRSENSWIWLCRPGTSDFIAVLNNKKGTLTVLFIEAKSPDVKAEPRKGKQKEFRDKYSCKHIDMQYMIAQSGEEVSRKILDLAFDRLSAIQF